MFTNSQTFGYSLTKDKGTNDCNKQSHCVDRGSSENLQVGQTVSNNGQTTHSIGTHAEVGVKTSAGFDIGVASANVETSFSAGINTNHQFSSGKDQTSLIIYI